MHRLPTHADRRAAAQRGPGAFGAVPADTPPVRPSGAAASVGVPVAILPVAALCIAGAAGGPAEARGGRATDLRGTPGRLVESASLHLIAAVTLAARREAATVRPVVQRHGADPAVRRPVPPARPIRTPIDLRRLDLPPPARG